MGTQLQGASMEQMASTLLEIARGMWRRRWVGVLAAWVVGVAGGFFVMSYPNRYQAIARLYVDTKTVLRPLMYGVIVEPNTDASALALSKTLITRPNVERLVQELRLDAGANDQAARDAIYNSVLSRLRIVSYGRDGIYNFAFMDVNPERARLVVQGLVDMFLDADRQSKQRDVKLAQRFLDDQIKEYEAKLADADSRLKEFKLRNPSTASGRDYFVRISAVEDELTRLIVELRAAEESRDALKRELASETATLTPDLSVLEVAATTEYDARLEAQRKQLDELLRRYTELHPDVISTRRVISRLEEQRAAEIEARKGLGQPRRAAPTAQAEAAQRGKLAFAEAEANVASLRYRVNDAQTRMNQLRASASRVPQIEGELAQLTRDYEGARRAYESMVGRREKAALSEETDANMRAEQFRLIEPPRTGREPIFPSRNSLAPLVILFALLVGVVASALADRLWPTFASAKSLRLGTDRPVLGSISMLVSPVVQRRARQMTLAFGGSVLTLLMVGVVWARWVRLSSVPL